MMEENEKHPVEQVNVSTPEGGLIEIPKGMKVKHLLPASHDENGLPYLGVLLNNDVCSTEYPIDVNSKMELLTFKNHDGIRIYRRSLTFLIAKAIQDLRPGAHFSAEHSLGTGYFCRYEDQGEICNSQAQLDELEAQMNKLIAEDIPFRRYRISFEDAYHVLEKRGERDKLNLLRFRNPPKITLFSLDDYYDHCIGVLAPSTGLVNKFKLIPYDLGFILQFPELNEGKLQICPYIDQPHLHDIFVERKEWGKSIGIETVGDLNERIANKEHEGLVKTSEAFHEKKLSVIADEISKRKDSLKYILIAGPSSAGKTTFSKRLAIHLQVNGFQPITIECDNYFVNRKDTPLDSSGEYDFEHVDALDLELFNKHLADLADGKEVDMPTFNFPEGKQEFLGNTMKMNHDNIALIEGIHCLNPKMLEGVPREQIFKIYINNLTQLKLDNRQRISTTDVRLLRRMVRDARTRGHSSLRTLQLWANVRSGETKWIFPFQQESDATFNSCLDYELAVLKHFALPLLAEVKPFHKEYAETRRLQDFMEMLLPAPADKIPSNSLLREFIGGSDFHDD